MKNLSQNIIIFKYMLLLFFFALSFHSKQHRLAIEKGLEENDAPMPSECVVDAIEKLLKVVL